MEHVEHMVARRGGLQLREQEREALRKIVAARLQSLKLSPESYCRLLEGGVAGSEAEWAHIFANLTNNESYFFRDAGQLALLEGSILPELIERNQSTRTLRLWSAGCSTGEEPYSLAMMLDELLPRSESWNVLILGTDLSQAALDKARGGVYGPWSFRATSPRRREHYFQPQPRTFEAGAFSLKSPAARDDSSLKVEPRIQRAVTLQAGNLVSDAFPSPSSGLFDMDLIVCRNVFIYFSREAIARVVEKFSRTLRPGGYLLTGHAELHDAPLHGLQPRAFPQSIIYQRPPAPAQPHAHAQPEVAAPLPQLRPPAPASTWRPDAASVAASPEPNIAEVGAANEVGLLLLSAQAQADAGHHERARELCRRAMAVDALSPAAHQLLAHIAWEEGDREAAKSLFKKVIYLAPTLVWPYIEMDAIYRQEGDAAHARIMRRAALQVLAALPPESAVPHASPQHSAAPASPGLASAQVTAAQLVEHLKALG